jgi:hypothetical protein
MSVTYTDHEYDRRDDVVEEAYVPVYARKRAARGRAGARGFKTWMILAPLGVLVVGGASAAMLMNGGEAEVVEAPAASSPALAQAPLTDLMTSTAASDPAALTALRPAEPVATAPVAAAPVAAPAPVRRAAPVQRRTAPAAAPVESTAADDAGDEATADLNRAQPTRSATAPTFAPAPVAPTATPPAPTIQVQPFPGQ